MIHQRLFVSFLLIAAIFTCVNLSPSIGQDASNYLLLQNGNVLKGVVRSEKDRVSVSLDGNSNVYLTPKQILHIGPTLESLYQYQRTVVRQWGTGEHWQLSHWCIQQGLLDHAIEHFKALEQSASDSPRYKQLEHELREALLADQQVQMLLQKRNPIEDPASAEPIQSAVGDVVQASAESSRFKSAANVVTEAESTDSWNKHEIPSYIRTTFHKTILPVLVSRCGQSGCHGMLGKSEFHIYQPLGDQAAIMLARDLDAVLKYIDRDRGQDSILLAYATKAHGIQRNPSLSASRPDERAHIERLQFWIKSLVLSKKPETTMPVQFPVASAVSGQASPAVGAAVTSAVANIPTPNASTSNRKSRLLTEVEEDRNAKLSKPPKSAPDAEFLTMSEISQLEKAIEKFEKQTGGFDASSSKKDPFAPDVFNRKFK